ncbi:hypothetical protein V8F06_005240 [Rhypophila decipiens]
MSVLEKLRDRLKRCRIEDASQPGRHFVPKGALVDALQRRDIEQALAQPAFDIPLHAREDDCHIVVESGLAQDVLDQTLPVTDDKLEAIVGEEDATIFAQEQWMFLPVCLDYHRLGRQLRGKPVFPYTEMQLLSSGGRCSRVYKVKIHPEYNKLLRGSGEKETTTFILKQIYPQTQPKSKRTESELLHYLRSLKHENIVELLTSYWLDDVPNLIFRCADCDLGDFLQRPRPPSLAKPRQILNALHGLACGLRHLHDFRLQVTTEHDHSSLSLQGCHHDLKPQNVLVQGSTFILSDFGLSRLKGIEDDSKTPWQYAAREYGAPECRNPETFEVGRVGRASDVWSLGCIALEVLTFIRDGPEGVKDFRSRRRFDGPETTTFSYHHDGNPSPDVEAQIAALAQPAMDAVEAFSTPFLQDMFSVEVLERPVMAVVEPRFGHAAIRTALASLLASVDARVASPRDSKKRSHVFHAQKSLEVFRLKSWAMALDFLPLDEDELSQETANESSRDVRSLPSFREIYQLLDNADFSINDQAIRSSQDTTLHDDWDDGIDDNLVPELHQLNNRLHRLLSKTESAKADQLFPRLLRSIGDDENLLRAIGEEASSRGSSDSQSVALLAAMRYMTSLLHKNADRPTARIDPAQITVDDQPPNDSKVGPLVYLYHLDHNNAVEVHVEKVSYGHQWINAIPNSQEFIKGGEKLFERFDQLSAFLRDTGSQRPPGLRILNCIGAYHWPEKSHFGLVFQLPNPEEHLVTLHKLIDLRKSRTHPPPSVDEKHKLAYAVAATLMWLHAAKWLHKNLNPHNVVFSLHSWTDFRGVKYEEPFLIGFDYTRPDGIDQYTEGPDKSMRAEYQHPAYRSRSASAFKTSFDYYALGLILLEVGLWAPLSGVYQRNLEASPEQLTKLYQVECVKKLDKAMPSRYANAVNECLQMTGRDELKEELIFHTRVMPVLTDLASQAC